MKFFYKLVLFGTFSISAGLNADLLEERVNTLESTVRLQGAQADLLRRDVDKLKISVGAIPTPVGLVPKETQTYTIKSDCSDITPGWKFSNEYYILKILGEKACAGVTFVTVQIQGENGVGYLTINKRDGVYFKP